jgi:hypothetical protein
VSDRRVRLCGYAIAVLMNAINTIDSALETVYDYVTSGMRQAAIDYTYQVEKNIDTALFFLWLAERACNVSPEAGKTFEDDANRLKGKLDEVRKDPRKARDYRYYRITLAKDVKRMLSD